AELQQAGIEADAVIIHDDLDHLQQKLQPLIAGHDVVLTCGGVLDGDKDLTIQAMDGLGVTSVFRRVRVGPGKGICMGKKGNTLIFNLPGGPPSNHVAFLLLALPGIRRLTGIQEPFSGMEQAVITSQVKGQTGWTQVGYAKLKNTYPRTATPVCNTSRLQAMADANCLIELPEDVGSIEAGAVGTVWKIR
ncbi:MAG: hypothetical protein GQ559_05515, partial [Desulfobulbaceae bacterium]|nr:hypothetical protein [Desulfobulbaceae bacterium]